MDQCTYLSFRSSLLFGWLLFFLAILLTNRAEYNSKVKWKQIMNLSFKKKEEEINLGSFQSLWYKHILTYICVYIDITTFTYMSFRWICQRWSDMSHDIFIFSGTLTSPQCRFYLQVRCLTSATWIGHPTSDPPWSLNPHGWLVSNLRRPIGTIWSPDILFTISWQYPL